MLKDIFNRYGFWGSISLILDIIYTRSYNIHARIIRRPLYLRGKQNIIFYKNLTTGVGCRIEANPLKRGSICLSLGENVQINDYVHIGAIDNVIIGNNVLIASKVFITDHNHGNYSFSGNDQDSPFCPPYERPLYSNPVVIEDNVWLGEYVTVLPGVRIGFGSIVGSGAIVTKSIPPYSIAVGNPAKVIKKFNLDSKKWELADG